MRTIPLIRPENVKLAVLHVSENALMTFGTESDQQRTPSQASTLSPSLSSRETRSTTLPQESIETARNILDSIIPTQVSSNSNLEHLEHSEFNVMEAFDAIH